MMNSDEEHPSELERLLASSRPTTDAKRTAELNYAAGVAAGRNTVIKTKNNRRWLGVLSHSCSALAGSLVMLTVLSTGSLKWSSLQPGQVLGKSDVPQNAKDAYQPMSPSYEQSELRSDSQDRLTSVLSRRLVEVLTWPPSNTNPTNTGGSDSGDAIQLDNQPTRPFSARSTVF